MPSWLRGKEKAKEVPVAAAATGKAAASSEQIELALLAGIRNGRRQDFEALYRIYYPRLQRFLAHQMRHADLIDEVLNDTLMVVWQRADSFEGGSKLSTWIFGIAYRKSMKALSRLDLPQDDSEAEEQVDPGPGPEQQLGQRELRARLLAVLGQLSAEHRAVVELCYFHDMAYGEIAQVVGCGAETVKTRMFYARRRLRGLLADLADSVVTSQDGESR